MTAKVSRSVFFVSLFIFMAAFGLLFLSSTGYALGGGDEDTITVNVSSKTINYESKRGGEIRIFTSLSYSEYAASGESVFVYFNGSDSVENIRTTRDSLGHLILKFKMEELEAIETDLRFHESNTVTVVISMNDLREITGQCEVFITLKKTRTEK